MAIELAPHNPYGLALRSRVIIAAGCAGYGSEATRVIDAALLGGMVTRTTTLEPRRAPRPPRLLETPAGLLAVGPWHNPGIRRAVEQHAAEWATTPVIMSIAARVPADLARMAGMLEGVEGIAGVELSNLDENAAAAITAARAATQLPLLAKLPPLDPAPLAALAYAAAAAGADALVVAAAPIGSYTDAGGERVDGWLCGPALLPLTVQRIAQVAAAVHVPVIGCGGIASLEHAQQALAAGATAVQIGSAFLLDPFAVVKIAAALHG